MNQVIIIKENARWYFNGQLYQELSGYEKLFVDNMLSEVKIDHIEHDRVRNEALKRFNYKFPSK